MSVTQLQLGAGGKTLQGWINVDIAPLPGVDVVHDLTCRPWPFANGSIHYLLAHDVIEHLDDLVKTMEEIHRILTKDGIAEIRVPFWNSYGFNTDPTHRIRFSEDTFSFFIPGTTYCNERSYYSKARFRLIEEVFVVNPINPKLPLPFLREFRVRSRIGKRILEILANTFNNVIQDIEIKLAKIEDHARS
jgi:SAM-dependent methyltransferase